MQTKQLKKYMHGNYVRLKENNEIHTVEYDNYNYVMLNSRNKVQGMFFKNDIEDIYLDDDFFVNNGYFFDCEPELFIADSGYGPAIKKYIVDNSNAVEYAIAGIIIRTVDEFQNIMNIIGCERIADSIKV